MSPHGQFCHQFSLFHIHIYVYCAVKYLELIFCLFLCHELIWKWSTGGRHEPETVYFITGDKDGEGIIAKCACSTNHTRIIFKNGISQGNYMVTKLPVQWYPRIFKSILNSSLTYIKCLDYLHFQASFSPVFFLLQVQGVSCNFCPEKVVCLGFIEGTFSNLSLQGRHFRGG